MRCPFCSHVTQLQPMRKKRRLLQGILGNLPRRAGLMDLDLVVARVLPILTWGSRSTEDEDTP